MAPLPVKDMEVKQQLKLSAEKDVTEAVKDEAHPQAHGEVAKMTEELKQQLKLSVQEEDSDSGNDEAHPHAHGEHGKHAHGHHHKDHGVDVGTGKGFKVTVSNLAGYMCHIQLEAYFELEPHDVFTILTYPDNSPIFRDIQRVGSRRVVEMKPGLKIVEAEQLQEMRVLWMHRTYSTLLTVREESQDAPNHCIQFDLLKSDVLKRFSGRWEFTPECDGDGKVIGTWGVLTQDVLPKGIPPWITRIPMLGGAIRGGALRAVSRIMEDIQAIIPKMKEAKAQGRTVEDEMRRLCGTCDEAGHANGKVTSFAVTDSSDDEDDDEVGEIGKGGEEAGAEESEKGHARLVSVKLTCTTREDGESGVHLNLSTNDGEGK